jgi:hypothetical protein
MQALPAAAEFFCGAGRTWIYDRASGIMRTGDAVAEIPIARALFAPTGSEFVYSPDRCTLRNETDATVCRSESKILAIAASHVFRIVVFATVENGVFFRDLPKGRVLADAAVESYVTAIAITPKWVFVLVFAEAELRLFDVNGF